MHFYLEAKHLVLSIDTFCMSVEGRLFKNRRIGTFCACHLVLLSNLNWLLRGSFIYIYKKMES